MACALWSSRRRVRGSCARRQRHPCCRAASVTGRGRGFSPCTGAGPGRCDDRPSHHCQDAAVLTGNAYAPALGVLTLLGGAAPCSVAVAAASGAARSPTRTVRLSSVAPRPGRCRRGSWLYCGFTAITMLKFWHVRVAVVSHGQPRRMAAPWSRWSIRTMATQMLTALASGFSYDECAKTLAVLPIL